jgi:hypothetical protein
MGHIKFVYPWVLKTIRNHLVAIIKLTKREGNFLVVDKSCLNDPAISLSAKGLYAYLMGLPQNWDLNIDDLAKRSRNGRDATRTAFNELVSAGYIEKKTLREKGKFQGIEYVAYEIPTLSSSYSNPTKAPKDELNDSSFSKQLKNREAEIKSINNSRDKLFDVKPFPGFPQLISNEISNKNINISIPLGFTPSGKTIDTALAKGLTSVLDKSEIERFITWNANREHKHSPARWQELILA